MAVLADQILIQFIGDMRQLNSSLDKVNKNLDKTKSAAQGVNTVINASFAAAGVAIAVGVKKAIEFETSMAKVNSMLNLNSVELQALGNQVEDLSTKYGKSANKIADALFDVSSAGFKGAEAMNVLNASLELSLAGFSDVKTTNEAVVRSIKAFNLQSSQASKVSKILFAAMKTGLVSMQELASVWPKVAASANAANVPIEEAAAAFSKLTDVFKAAEAATLVDRFFNKIATGGKKVQFLRNALGRGGLGAAISELKAATAGDPLSLKNLGFADNELKAAIQLMSGFEDRLKAVKDAQNDLQGAAKAAGQTTEVRLKRTIEELNKQLRELGNSVIPILNKVLKALNTNTGKTAAGITAVGIGVLASIPILRNFIGVLDGLIQGLTGVGKSIFGLKEGMFLAISNPFFEFIFNVGKNVRLLTQAIFSLNNALLALKAIAVAIVAAAGFFFGDWIAGGNLFAKTIDYLSDKWAKYKVTISDVSKATRELVKANKEFAASASDDNKVKVLEAQLNRIIALRRALIENKKQNGSLNVSYIKSLKPLADRIKAKKEEIKLLKDQINLEAKLAAEQAARISEQRSNIVELSKLWKSSQTALGEIRTTGAQTSKDKFINNELSNLLKQRKVYTDLITKIEKIGNSQTGWNVNLIKGIQLTQKELTILDAKIAKQKELLDIIYTGQEREKILSKELERLNKIDDFITTNPIEAQIKALKRQRDALMANAKSWKESNAILLAYQRRLAAIQQSNVGPAPGVAASEFGTQQAVSMRLAAQRERENASNSQQMKIDVENKNANQAVEKNTKDIKNELVKTRASVKQAKQTVVTF